METEANYVRVGMFTVIVAAIAFAMIYFIADIGARKNNLPLDVRIPGSVSGLGTGSGVFFNGIPVGRVQRLEIDPDNPNMVIAKTEVDAATPITRSTVATLGFQGLTGMAFIELKGGALNEHNLLQIAEEGGYVARIDSDADTINNLLATAQDIAGKANGILTDIEEFVTDIRGPLTRTVESTEEFAKTLDDNRGNIESILTDGRDMMQRLNNASKGVDDLMVRLNNMLSPDDEDSVIVQTKETLRSIQETADNINSRIGPIANNIESFSGQGLREVEGFVSDMRRSVARIERAISDLERNPQRLIFGGSGSVPEYDGRNRR